MELGSGQRLVGLRYPEQLIPEVTLFLKEQDAVNSILVSCYCCFFPPHAFFSGGGMGEGLVFKTDSVQSSSNTCKNYLLKIYSQHGNFLNAILKHLIEIQFSK